MPSPFAKRFQSRHSRLEKRFGEMVRIVPRTPGRYTAGENDGTRAQRDLRAIIHETPADQRTDGESIGSSDFGVKLQAQRTVAHFGAELFASQADWPRKDDRLIRLELPGEPAFEVVKASFDGVSEVICPVCTALASLSVRKRRRSAASLIDAARWGEAGVKVLGNLRTWATTVSLASGFNPRQVIMDPLAAELLLADAEMKELLDNRRQRSGSVELAGAVTGAQGEEVVHLGSIGQFEFWQYQQIYSDDAGAVQKYMPDYTVLLGSPAGAEGVRCYGAILDTKVLRAMSRFPKMWDQDDPSVTTLMTQSAPLPVLKRPAATMCVTVR